MRLIDADALKEAFLNHSCTEFEIKNKCRTDENVLALIDNAPTVETYTEEDMAGAYNEGYACGNRESERPKGEWIKIFENPFTNGYLCPFCGHKIQVTEKFLPEVTECESCGADMRGEDNG